MQRLVLILAFVLGAASVARGQEVPAFAVWADAELRESGLMGYILPRFSLKTNRRAELVSQAEAADIVVGRVETAGLFTGDGTVFGIVALGENAAAQMFADWLGSDIGGRTIAAFRAPQGATYAPVTVQVEIVEVTFEGDPLSGETLARQHCGRCHRVTQSRSGMGIGSTPSFPALRALPDWYERFLSFFALNPHPAFLRLEGISPPFDPLRPPPIVPLELTLDEVADIQSYAAGLTPADLGPEIVHQ